jgi:metal-responsive CopG/Arc/MetJ family transcriptional regulator
MDELDNSIMVCLQQDQIAALDAWISEQGAIMSRSEAIRTLLQTALPAANTTAVRGEFG